MSSGPAQATVSDPVSKTKPTKQGGTPRSKDFPVTLTMGLWRLASPIGRVCVRGPGINPQRFINCKWRLRQEDQKFKVIFSCIVSLKPAWAAWDSVSTSVYDCVWKSMCVCVSFTKAQCNRFSYCRLWSKSQSSWSRVGVSKVSPPRCSSVVCAFPSFA